MQPKPTKFLKEQEKGLTTGPNDISYREAQIDPTHEGISMSTPKSLFVPRVDPNHPFYREHQEPFDLAKFRFPKPPIDLGDSELSLSNLDSIPNVLRLPIKFPGTDIRLPAELAGLKPFVQRMLEYEAGFNDAIAQTFVHITYDHRTVPANKSHRYLGFHTDGLQGAKFSQDQYTPVEHSYIISTSPPTEFCLQPFFVEHLHDAKHNLFKEMEAQVRPDNIYETLPGHIYLIDPYMVHRSPFIEKETDRVFIRLTIAYAELKNPHNTYNPLFGGQNYSERHDIRKFLTVYPGGVPWPYYGLSNGPKRLLTHPSPAGEQRT